MILHGSRAGRLDSPREKSRPYNHIYITRKPRPVPACPVGRGRELHFPVETREEEYQCLNLLWSL
jgi:hypothetical protein